MSGKVQSGTTEVKANMKVSEKKPTPTLITEDMPAAGVSQKEFIHEDSKKGEEEE